MKKLLAILLAAMMLLSLAACGNKDDNPSGSENNPGSSQSDNQGGTENQGGEEVSGQDYDNVGFTKAQRQVIAEQIGVTTEGEKVVFMYVAEEGDPAVYFDVYDEFNGTTCRINEWVFCIDKETYDDEYNGYVDEGDDVTADEKNLYFCMRGESNYDLGTWQDMMDYYDEHWTTRTDIVIVE